MEARQGPPANSFLCRAPSCEGLARALSNSASRTVTPPEGPHRQSWSRLRADWAGQRRKAQETELARAGNRRKQSWTAQETELDSAGERRNMQENAGNRVGQGRIPQETELDSAGNGVGHRRKAQDNAGKHRKQSWTGQEAELDRDRAGNRKQSRTGQETELDRVGNWGRAVQGNAGKRRTAQESARKLRKTQEPELVSAGNRVAWLKA